MADVITPQENVDSRELYQVASPISPAKPTELQTTPSMREKEVARRPIPMGGKLSEKDLKSPISPITNYEEKPYEAPQVISVDAKYLLHERDIAEEAPQVYESSPPYVCTGEDIESQRDPGTAVSRNTSRRSATAMDDGSADGKDNDSLERRRKKKRICGMPAKVFWIFLGILIGVIIAGAVGGGVGGYMVGQNRANQAEAKASLDAALASATNNPSTTSTPSQPTTSAPTRTKASLLPSQTDGSLGPVVTGWYFTAFSGKNFTGHSYKWTDDQMGMFRFIFPPANPVMQPNPFGDKNNASTAFYNSTWANSYYWVPTDSGCCVRFCQDQENIGYRCTSLTLQQNAKFNKIFLTCGGTPREDACGGEGTLLDFRNSTRKRDVSQPSSTHRGFSALRLFSWL